MPPRDRINSFDDDSVRLIAESVRRLESQVRNLREQMQLVERAGRSETAVRLLAGRTTVYTQQQAEELAPLLGTTEDTLTQYPEDGSTFVVQLQTWQHGGLPGDEGRTDTVEHEEDKYIAQTVGGHWLPESTPVVLMQLPSIDAGEQWWILTGPALQQLELVADVYDGVTHLFQRRHQVQIPVGSVLDTIDAVIPFTDCQQDSADCTDAEYFGIGENADSGNVAAYSKAVGQATLELSIPEDYWHETELGSFEITAQWYDGSEWHDIGGEAINQRGNDECNNRYTIDIDESEFRSGDDIGESVQLRVKISDYENMPGFSSDPEYTNAETVALWDGSSDPSDYSPFDPDYVP